MSNPPSVLHVDGGRGWGGGQNQVRLLMRAMAGFNVRQLCICPAGSPLAAALHQAALPVRPVKWRTGSDPRALWAIGRIAGDFDIIHCHDAHALQLALLPARLRGARVVAARRVRFRTSALKWNRADVVIAVSRTVERGLIASGIDAHRVRVIHSGTDRAETRAVPPLAPSARRRFGIPEDAFVAGNAAAFVPVKNHAIIPAAAALLPDVHWLIAGDGPERGVIEAAIRRHGVGDRVHLLGWLADARAMLKELDAYVSTSTDDGLGNSITESLALGIPVVAAAAGGPAEIMQPIHDRIGGILFEPRDPAALAESLRRMREPGVRTAVVALQNTRFEDFTIERTARATFDVYLGLVSQ